MRTIFLLLLPALAACAEKTNPVDQTEMERLREVRDSLRYTIRIMDRDSSSRPESIVGALRSARREILETTEAMLQQRLEALAAGTEFRRVEEIPAADPARADSLLRVIRDQLDSVYALESQLVVISPNSLDARILQMRIEAHQATRAFTDLARLAAVYGLDLRPNKVQ